MRAWETEIGVGFLRKIGLEDGQRVLDFGCRVGHYSIPAAIAVGTKGVVYALDRKKDPLRKLQRKAEKNNLANIKPVLSVENEKIDLRANSIDVAMLYDVLHIMDAKERGFVYSEMHRLLKDNGILSVYPKHIATDYPMYEFRDFREDDVRAEIENADFRFERRICGTLSHDEYLNTGCILNFRKAVQ